MKKSKVTFKVLAKKETLKLKGGRRRRQRTQTDEMGYICPPPDTDDGDPVG